MYNYYWQCMPYMKMDEEDHDLERMYPEIYHRVYPMVVMHCEKMEMKYGWMYSPSNKDLEEACEDIYERTKDYLDEMEDENEHDDYKEYTRQRPYGRRRSLNDLFRILLIRELLGRRRRRRRPYYGYGNGYGSGYWY